MRTRNTALGAILRQGRQGLLVCLAWALLQEPAAGAVVTTPAVAPSCSSNTTSVMLNEIKSQGGALGLDFVEIFILGNAVSLSGYRIWAYNYSGALPSDWSKGSMANTATIELGAGNGCVNYTGSNSGFNSCSSKDSAGSLFDYPTYLVYKLPNMDEADGAQLALFDASGNLVDQIAYDTGSSCSASYWTAPGGCLNNSGCLTNFSASSADLSRSADGTGPWVDNGNINTQGTSNAPGAPAGGAGYKFYFPAYGLCTGSNNSITVTAAWVDSSGAFLAPAPVAYSAYAGSGFQLTQSGSATATVGAWSNGSATIAISDNISETITLTAVNTAIPGTFTSRDYSFDPANCAASFDAYEPSGYTITDARNGTARIKTHVAGGSNLCIYNGPSNSGVCSLTVAAFNSAMLGTRNFTSGFAGPVKVESVDASSGSCGTYSALVPAASVGIAGASGLGSVTLPAVSGAHANVRVRVSYPATGIATVIGCSSDNFAIRPASLNAVAASDASWTTAGNTNTLNTTDAAAAPIHKAGRPFSIAATAVDGSGNTVANYNGTPSAALATCGGTACTATFGNLGVGAGFAAGLLASTAATYDNVGAFDMTLQDTTFADVDAADSSVSERYVSSMAVSVGRFVPDHYTLSSPLLTTRSDLACGTASTFNYMDEDFAIAYTLTAEQYPGGITSLYGGALARLDLAAPANLGFGASHATTDLTSRIKAVSGSGTWSNGVASAAAATLQLLARTASPVAAPSGPYDSFQLGMAPLDADGVTLDAAVLDLDVDNNAAYDHQLLAATALRFGRLKLANALGSELLALPLALEAQYWNGTRFVRNTEDACTAFVSGWVTLNSFTKNLDSGETTAGPATIGVAGGVGAVVLSKPTDLDADGVNGSATVGIDLAGAGLGYLQGNWGGSSAYGVNPSAIATFGVYKNANQFIYLRENY